MKVDVEGLGYTEASALLHHANVWAGDHYSRLTDALSGSGAMAGDSSFATSWATAYDEAATTLLGSFTDAVSACSTLGRLTFASHENHRRAERASTLDAVVVTHDPDVLDGDWIGVLRTTPPTSLGGDPSSLPGWANMVLDHVEGFVWPDADLDRLRATATTWRTAGDALGDLATHPRRAIDALLRELSPEVLPATAAIGRLAASLDDLSSGCYELAALCEEYADAVEAQREAMLDLARDLLRDAVIIQSAGFLVGLISLGTANGGALAVNAAKLAAAAPRFKHLLDTLRLYAEAAAASLHGTRLAMAGVGTRLRPMADARMLMTAEVGQAGSKATKATSLLKRHEGGPFDAHSVREHVGKPDSYLWSRILEGKKRASTFTDEVVADDVASQVLSQHADELTQWLKSNPDHALVLRGDFSQTIGRVMDASGSVTPASKAKFVVLADDTMPDGYRILTSYPIL